uniref:Uncharacterized protein n=1 Tax=Heterorhabditis bacteriophora TaxID=37862 RepID=A0A1I7WM10_HETBA
MKLEASTARLCRKQRFGWH